MRFDTVLARYAYMVEQRQQKMKAAADRGLTRERDSEKEALLELFENDYYMDEIRKENKRLAAQLRGEEPGT